MQRLVSVTGLIRFISAPSRTLRPQRRERDRGEAAARAAAGTVRYGDGGQVDEHLRLPDVPGRGGDPHPRRPQTHSQ